VPASFWLLQHEEFGFSVNNATPLSRPKYLSSPMGRNRAKALFLPNYLR
jgi:hypothetical protein